MKYAEFALLQYKWCLWFPWFLRCPWLSLVPIVPLRPDFSFTTQIHAFHTASNKKLGMEAWEQGYENTGVHGIDLATLQGKYK